MIRLILAAMFALLPLVAHAQTEPQTLVDRATLALQEMLSNPDANEARTLMTKSKGAVVCPRLFKAGFIIGGQGGDCVLLGRGQGDGWSSPAFYAMGSGSVGLQIGIQDSEVLFIVLTNKGLQALLDSQFKIGGDASVAFANLGGGVQGSTTTALRADIVAFSMSRGLYAGLSLEGSVLSQRSDWNAAYYGHPTASQSIINAGDGQNPGAGPLRDMLARYSAGTGPISVPPGAPATMSGAPATMGQDNNYAPPPQAAPAGTVSATPLAPPG